MSPNIVRFFASRFSGFKGFRIVPYPHRLGVITPDGKRHVFLEESAFLKFAGDQVSDLIFSKQQNTTQTTKEK